MKRLIPSFIITLLPVIAIAQNQVDALRYSQAFGGSTARSAAMGGAFGALGGDFYSISQNPAGLGVYRGSELTFTPELYYTFSKSRYFGNTSDDFKYDFRFGNLGYVATFDLSETGLVSWNFGFGFNKVNHFSDNVLIQGNNRTSSIGDDFVDWANYNQHGLSELEPFTGGLFYDGGIMFMNNAGMYQLDTVIRNPSGNINIDQQNLISRRGRMNEWSIALGFNINHKLYLGGSFVMTPVEYTEQSSFRESAASGSPVEYFEYHESLNVEGTGYSGKIGAIFRPVNFLRLGAAYHFPVSYYFDETYDAQLRSYKVNTWIDPVDSEGEIIDYLRNDYRITTPGKAVGSIALTLGKFAILSGDVEYVNYEAMSLSTGDLAYDSDINNTIEEIYTNNINLKTGFELRSGTVYFRGGFGYYGSPYKSDQINSDAYKLNYTGGIGLRSEKFFVDFALSYLTGEENHVLYYSPFNANPVSSEILSDKVRGMVTFGFRF